ncbi:MAG TPA: hypothetical protein VGF34_14740 [Stellaceae bacterium]|jgi:hypothetical protein
MRVWIVGLLMGWMLWGAAGDAFALSCPSSGALFAEKTGSNKSLLLALDPTQEGGGPIGLAVKWIAPNGKAMTVSTHLPQIVSLTVKAGSEVTYSCIDRGNVEPSFSTQIEGAGFDCASARTAVLFREMGGFALNATIDIRNRGSGPIEVTYADAAKTIPFTVKAGGFLAASLALRPGSRLSYRCPGATTSGTLDLEVRLF